MPRDVAPPSTRKFQTLYAASAQYSEESWLIKEGRPLSIKVIFSPGISQPSLPSQARRNEHTAQRSKIRLQEEQPELENADRIAELLWERTAHTSPAPPPTPSMPLRLLSSRPAILSSTVGGSPISLQINTH